MYRFACAILVVMLGPPTALRAEVPESAVTDYEARLEQISKELLTIRRELETLVAEVVQQDLGRVFIFIKTPLPAWEEAGVAVAVDGKTVFSRTFTPAELDVLKRGLPLELADLRLPAGVHRVSLNVPGEPPSEPESLTVKRGSLTSLVAAGVESGVKWHIE